MALLLRRELTRALADDAMTPEQWQVMAALTLKDKHSVSRSIARLEHRGWIERRTKGADGRAVHLHLTAKGRDLEREAPAGLSRAFIPVTRTLAPGKQQVLPDTLKQLRAALGDA